MTSKTICVNYSDEILTDFKVYRFPDSCDKSYPWVTEHSRYYLVLLMWLEFTPIIRFIKRWSTVKRRGTFLKEGIYKSDLNKAKRTVRDLNIVVET